jgi:hypothetical protein
MKRPSRPVTWLRRLWHRCAARPGAVPRPPWLLRRAVNERGTARRARCLSASSLIASAFWGAHFEGANLVEAHLESANLLDAQFDERARLGQAHLEGATLSVRRYPKNTSNPRSAMLRRGSRSGYRVRFGGLQSNPPPEKHSSAPNGPRGQTLGEGTDRAPDHAGRRIAGAAPARPEPVNPLIR